MPSCSLVLQEGQFVNVLSVVLGGSCMSPIVPTDLDRAGLEKHACEAFLNLLVYAYVIAICSLFSL